MDILINGLALLGGLYLVVWIFGMYLDRVQGTGRVSSSRMDHEKRMMARRRKYN